MKFFIIVLNWNINFFYLSNIVKEFARYLEERERKRYEMERKQRLVQRRTQEKETMERLQKEQRQKRSSENGNFLFPIKHFGNFNL